MAVWGRARYLSVTEAPTVLNLHEWAGKKHFVSLKLECQSGARTRDIRLSKQRLRPATVDSDDVLQSRKAVTSSLKVITQLRDSTHKPDSSTYLF